MQTKQSSGDLKYALFIIKTVAWLVADPNSVRMSYDDDDDVFAVFVPAQVHSMKGNFFIISRLVI